jgi:hypothetical protein
MKPEQTEFMLQLSLEPLHPSLMISAQPAFRLLLSPMKLEQTEFRLMLSG